MPRPTVRTVSARCGDEYGVRLRGAARAIRKANVRPRVGFSDEPFGKE